MSNKHDKDEGYHYFDHKETVTKYSTKKCSYSEFSNAKGTYKFNFACIPNQAKDTSDAFCYKCEPEQMPDYFDCSYFFSGYWQTDKSQFENMTCAGNCQGPPETKVIGTAVHAPTLISNLHTVATFAVLVWCILLSQKYF